MAVLFGLNGLCRQKKGLAKKLLTQQGLLTKVCNNLGDFSSMQGNINFRGTLILMFF